MLYRLLAGWSVILGLLILGGTWSWEPGDWGPPWCWVCGVTFLRIAAVISILIGGAALANSLRRPVAGPAGQLR